MEGGRPPVLSLRLAWPWAVGSISRERWELTAPCTFEGFAHTSGHRCRHCPGGLAVAVRDCDHQENYKRSDHRTHATITSVLPFGASLRAAATQAVGRLSMHSWLLSLFLARWKVRSGRGNKVHLPDGTDLPFDYRRDINENCFGHAPMGN